MHAYQTLVNTQAHAYKLIMIEGITAFVLPDGADMSANVSIAWYHLNQFLRAYFRNHSWAVILWESVMSCFCMKVFALTLTATIPTGRCIPLTARQKRFLSIANLPSSTRDVSKTSHISLSHCLLGLPLSLFPYLSFSPRWSFSSRHFFSNGQNTSASVFALSCWEIFHF